MYRFDFDQVIFYGNGYYTAVIRGITTDRTHLDNNLKMNIKVDVLNINNLNIDEENPLLLVKPDNFSPVTENLTTNLTVDQGDSITIQLKSIDLDNYVDSEIRPKFPNENVDAFKMQFVSDLCNFVTERGVE